MTLSDTAGANSGPEAEPAARPRALAARHMVRVELGARAYEVRIGSGLLADAGRHVAPLAGPRGRMAVVADREARRLHGATLAAGLRDGGLDCDWIDVAPGEASKSFASLERVCEALLELRLERGDLVLAFGGGVVGDLAGFAAGIVKRGLDFVQAPTTLLAQVDSSVGGKTAINARAGKNMVGLFWQPRLVLADGDALATLPRRDLAAGWAEVVKYGLIDDPEFFAWCAQAGLSALDGDAEALSDAVARSVAAKARIVAADEREAGQRALLNLGHTFAHAFEAEAGFDETALRHGEAVACGMAMAFRFSAELGLCAAADACAVEAALRAAGLPATPGALGGGGAGWNPERLLDAMGHDKKNEGGALTLILARGIGRAFVLKDAPRDALAAFLRKDTQS